MDFEFVLLLPVLLFSVVVHEVAHGWVALRQGDDTALMLGRITLNPVPHIDLFGSILFPVLLAASGAGFLFGWAKPVPVDPRKFRDWRKGDILVSLAGVTANLLLAVGFTAVLVALAVLGGGAGGAGAGTTLQMLARMAHYGVVINLVLAIFNLIPIPPLDGSHVLYHVLPPRLGARYRRVGRYGMLVLLALLFFAPGAFDFVMAPVGWVNSALAGLVRWLT